MAVAAAAAATAAVTPRQRRPSLKYSDASGVRFFHAKQRHAVFSVASAYLHAMRVSTSHAYLLSLYIPNSYITKLKHALFHYAYT